MSIRPFHIHIADADLDDLRERLRRARWPAQVPGTGWERGVPVEYVRGLADRWLYEYDWPAWEARLNAWPQFTTDIEGQRVHFLHVRSPEPGAVPLILTHGWPGSVVEFLHVVGPLTDPRTHGGDPADAFHVVAPSVPGFGFSTPLSSTGWNHPRIARAWAELMRRLGYERYGAQGGDTGHVVSPELGRSAAPSGVPTGIAVFPTDPAVRRFAEREHNVVHWSEFGRGGHFAAMEAPDLLVGDVRAFFRKLR